MSKIILSAFSFRWTARPDAGFLGLARWVSPGPPEQLQQEMATFEAFLLSPKGIHGGSEVYKLK